MPGQRLSISIYLSSVSFPAIETGRYFHVNGITVNKTTQTVESAAASGAFHIEDVYPLIDGGRFPVKRIAGERVEVWADIYRDGHDVVGAALVWRLERDREWRHEPMIHNGNDRWGGSFVPDQPGRYVYAIEAWTDEFATWRHGFERKQKAGADLTLDAIEGAGMLTKAQAGGHAAAHPGLGTLQDCRDFVAACRQHDLEVALDFAVQCSPDHPWLKQHPQWFKRRPDGSIRYAENPPKKYEDIINPDFYCSTSQQLWTALRDVVLFWLAQGVRIFRVDNP